MVVCNLDLFFIFFFFPRYFSVSPPPILFIIFSFHHYFFFLLFCWKIMLLSCFSITIHVLPHFSTIVHVLPQITHCLEHYKSQYFCFSSYIFLATKHAKYTAIFKWEQNPTITKIQISCKINLQQRTKPKSPVKQSNPTTKPISNRVNLNLQTHKSSWETNTKNLDRLNCEREKMNRW